jgi:O-antigen/teichoic acid export membrane protein
VWITALIAGLAALTAPAWASVVAPTGPVAEVVLAVVAAAGSAAVLNAQAYLRAVDGAWRFVGLAAVGALAGPVVGVALAAARPTATAYLWGVAGGWVLAAVAGMLAARKDGPARSYPGELRHALRIGLPSVPHQVALMLALGSLVVLAGHRLGLDQGGRLQVALFIGSGPLVLTAAVNNAWAPVIYRASPGDRPRVLAGTTQDVARLASLAAVGVSLLAPLLLTVATPADYDRPALVPVLALTSLSAVPSVLYLANVHLVFASGRSAGLAVVTPVCVAAGATVAWLTMPAAGLAAAALAFVGVYTALAGGVALLRRWIGQPDWPEGVVAVPLLISVVGAVAGALLPAGAWLPRLAGAAVALAATGLVLRHALRR